MGDLKSSKKIVKTNLTRRFLISCIPAFVATSIHLVNINFASNFNLFPLTLLIFIGTSVYFLIGLIEEFRNKNIEYSDEINSEFIKLKESFVKAQKEQKDAYDMHEEKNHEILRISINQGRFIMLDGSVALRYIAKNIDQYIEILNIRVRPSGEVPPSVKRATELWRDAAIKVFESNNDKLVFREIIVNDDILIEESKETKEAFEIALSKHNETNSKGYKKSYKYFLLPKDSSKILIRNFMLFTTKSKIRELYWGWYDPNKKEVGAESPYNTYYTTDKDMVDDYRKRFNTLLGAKKRKNNSHSP